MFQLEALGLNRLTQRDISLIRTIGKIRDVKEEGFFVDVDLLLTDEGLEPYYNIPTIRSKYYNYPIRKGDLVLLLTISHLQNDVMEKGNFADYPAVYDSYIAVPFNILSEFKTGKKETNTTEGDATETQPQEGSTDENEQVDFTNFFHLRTPEQNFQAYVNEEKTYITAKKVDFEAYFKAWKETIEETKECLIKGDYNATYESAYNDTIKGNLTHKTEGTADYSCESNVSYDIKGTYDIQVSGNFTIGTETHYEVNSQGSLMLQAAQPITIRVGENLGSLIAEGFNLIASSMTGPIPQSPSGVQSGPTMANGGQLSAVASRILRVVS